MKRLTYVAVLIFGIIGTSNAEAQILKRLVNKVKATLEQKTEEKAEHSITKAIDSLYAFETKKKSKSSSADDDSLIEKINQSRHVNVLSSIINAEKPVIKDTYIFTTRAVIEITNLKKKKNKPMLLTQHYGKMGVLNDFEENSTAMITDLENKALILLDTKRKTAQVQSLSWMDSIMENSNKQKDTTQYLNISKTGKEKRLNGYLCFEYHISFEGSKIEAWYAPDVAFDYTSYLMNLNKGFSRNSEFNKLADQKIGYMMEMTLINKDNKNVTKLLVKDVKQVTTKITMLNFQMIEMF